ncbi:MAG: hypothetical protein WAU53_03135 [Rhodoplanes sp.]
MSNEQNGDHLAHVVVRLVGDRGLHQNVGKVPNETVHRSANEVARRLMEISDEGRVEIEINGELIEPELIGYWRMLAREAINYPGEYEQLVRSIQRDIA